MENSSPKYNHRERTVRRSSQEDYLHLPSRQSFHISSLCHLRLKLSMLQPRLRLLQQSHPQQPSCSRRPYTRQTKQTTLEASGRLGRRLDRPKNRTQQCSGQPWEYPLSQAPSLPVLLCKLEALSLVDSPLRPATQWPCTRSTTHPAAAVQIGIEDRAVAIHAIASPAEEAAARKKKARIHLSGAAETRTRGVRRPHRRLCYRKPCKRHTMLFDLIMLRILREL